MIATVPKRSFRDPSGCVVRDHGRILRSVIPTEAPALRAFLETPVAQGLIGAGSVVSTTELASTRDSAWFEHESVSFPSYPFEWSPAMLAAAAALTLDLSGTILPSGFWLKDATPFNVLFRGPAPIFVDMLSFERRNPKQTVWRPLAQFVSTFLLPLALARRGHPLGDLLMRNRDGISPERAWHSTGWFDRARLPLLSLVSLPYLLGKLSAAKQAPAGERDEPDPERAGFILDTTYRWLQAQLHRVSKSGGRTSRWTGYMSNLSYDADEFEAKRRFVGAVVDSERPVRVLDVGSNTGHFSVLAARAGAEVVSIDSDPEVIDTLWRQASADHLNILPLVVDFARPTPAMGWRYTESDSFLERASGRFDVTLMLAVLHHLLVTDRIPLDEVIDVAADITRRSLVIEYVDPADPMFRQIARGRESLHTGLSIDTFTRSCERRFEVAASQEISPTRRLFHLRKR